jgi:hypothetical protein
VNDYRVNPILTYDRVLWSQLPIKGVSIAMVTSPEAIESEEYALYSLLIESWYVNDNTRLIVIEDEDQNELDLWGESLENSLEPLIEGLPDVSEEMIDVFRTRNIQPVPLKRLLSLSVPYVLIGSKEMEDIFQIDKDGWDEFYQRYPNSPGTITLSRVGFNSDMNRALVYIGIQSHWRAGSGHFVLLLKENDAWKVQSATMIWIS